MYITRWQAGISYDTKDSITDACIFVQFHYVDNKWDPCESSERFNRRGKGRVLAHICHKTVRRKNVKYCFLDALASLDFTLVSK